MYEENKAVVRRYFETFERQDQPAIDELVGPDFTFNVPGLPPIDFEGATRWAEMFYSAFPDYTHHIEELIAEGDTVAFRVTIRGTHKGEFQGVPPTGKQVAVEAYGLARVSGGRVVEHWGMPDMLTLMMMQQIGAIPAPARP